MGSSNARPAGRRRRGGRTARAARRVRLGKAPVPQPRRRIPVYAPFCEPDLIAIERHADWILDEIGIDVRGDAESRALFRAAGARVEGERVRFEPGLARALCATAPAQFAMHGRDPGRNVIIGGDHVVFLPAYGPPFVTDLDRGRRYAALEDFENFVKLSEASPWLHHSGGVVCEPVDVPVNKRHLDMVYAHLRYSTKPFMGAVTAPDRAEDSIEMARIAFGPEFVESHCVIQGNSLAGDAYREVGPGGAYLGTTHTLAHFETANYPSVLADTDSYERWLERGAPDQQRRANRVWKQMLADYVPPAMDEGVDEALLDFIERRRHELPDRWY